MLHLGVDLGSKTVKLVVLDELGNLVDESYERHLSDVPQTLVYRVHWLARKFPTESFTVGVTGSAGMQLSELCDLRFEQEVLAARAALARYAPEADVAIEIGGEDSKILFLSDGEELRMNNTCAGGTGSFIDNIAGMLDLKAADLNYYAFGSKTIYPIASRCAVFAQSDVRPLVNEGVSKADIAASTFNAVVTQCIGGLACGRPIRGKVAFLGGPLHFLSYLRDCFSRRLELSDDEVIVPSDAHLFVAKGAALLGWDTEPTTLACLEQKISGVAWNFYKSLERLDPLFESQKEYEAFLSEHQGVGARRVPLAKYEGRAFLGVDSGSEAIKYVLIGENGEFLRGYYKRSAGDVVEAAREMLVDLWDAIPRYIDGSPQVQIAHATVTGYGESYLREAFAFDSGEVETVAHVWAARNLVPDVDFLLDIGGQDIKCTYIKNGLIENVVLNEACSSGCGALLSGMAWSMNIDLQEFVRMALFAKSPVDLGTRCTVFMTSRVRHAQKEGADYGDISAGLAYSVVRNAIQKVIRVSDPSKLGSKIVVQGGTFSNDAVLRAFEKYYGIEVIRPQSPETMGAYGAALLARERAGRKDVSGLLGKNEIKSLVIEHENKICDVCSNGCHLTITKFNGEDNSEERVFTVGNRCARGAGAPQKPALPDMFEMKYSKLFSRRSLDRNVAKRGVIGIPRALNAYELYPFFHTVLTELGFCVVLSDPSSEELYQNGVQFVPSESMCFPSKLVFGHVQNLIDKGVNLLFAPYIKGVRGDMDECPVLASWPLSIRLSIDSLRLSSLDLISPVFTGIMDPGHIDRNVDALTEALRVVENAPSREEVKIAYTQGLSAQNGFNEEMRGLGAMLLEKMRREGTPCVILAGHPYHLDPMVHHGIPDMLGANGLAVFTEDALAVRAEESAHWEISNMMEAAAKAAAADDGLDFVQLYSFNCGPDAMVSDRVQDIMMAARKPYAVLKIDEMVDVASARIRVRSMMAARAKLERMRKRGVARGDAVGGR